MGFSLVKNTEIPLFLDLHYFVRKSVHSNADMLQQFETIYGNYFIFACRSEILALS